MSYILDALRKADAQRERDPARGIHAQTVQASPLERPEGHQPRLWLWGAAAIGAGLLAVAAWQLAGPAAPPVAVPVAVPVVPPVPYSPAARAGTPPAPAVTLPLPAPPMAAPAAPAAAVLPAAPPPSVPPVRAPAAPVAPAAVPLREARQPASALVAASPTPATPATDRVLSANELPADVQRELPKLAISGGVYSANPAQRMLIVNGQVLGEGTEPAPGVVLEQIRAKTAVLRYRGYRYAVSY